MTKILCTSKKDWLYQRSKVITATECSSLFALNPYASAAKMIRRKNFPEFQDNVFIRLGNILEPAVIRAVNIALGVEFIEPTTSEISFYVHDKYPLGATPDALGKKTLLECKSTSLDKFLNDWVDHPPYYYIMQVHVQLMCTKKKIGYLACIPTNMAPSSINEQVKLRIFMVSISKEIEDLIGQTVKQGYKCYINDEPYEHDREKNRYMKQLLRDSVKEIQWN